MMRAWMLSVVLLALILGGCNDDEPVESGAATSSEGTAATEAPLDPEVIFEDPPQYIGDMVTVRGEVADVVSPQGFTLASGLLVVGSSETVPANLPTGEPVLVTGLVEWFEISDVEEITGADVDREAYSRFSGRPSIIATEIRQADG